MNKNFCLFPGRFQPFHKGHKALIEKKLEEGKGVIVLLRDTKMGVDNPYSVKERKKMIRKQFPDKEMVKILSVPDFVEIMYGRKVGYEIKEVRLEQELENISATNIRNKK